MSTTTEGTLVEAGIKDLSAALGSLQITAVDLVAKYLLRIINYDFRNTALNSIPLINPDVFEEAAQSDDRRRAGKSLGPLDGIPFTVKDSYKVKGMTVACGSEAFEHLVSGEDAFTVSALRAAGAVLIGKTNMCPMAYGGMLRGLYGRAESPYNSKYLAAAFASGSSNGSGVSTGASFAAFGMGEETVSSGRSPASNNGLVAYTPSRGLISIRGNWPLYPTCDTVVPHTRTMDDLFQILDVVTGEDKETVGDFWRDQPFVNIPKAWDNRPSSFSSLKDLESLHGKKIAAPKMYLDPSSSEIHTSDAVMSLWSQAKSDLEACGAVVDIVEDFPVIQIYENAVKLGSKANEDDPQLPDDWNSKERGIVIAHAWDDFLRMNGDANFPALSAADLTKIFPHMTPDDPQIRFAEAANAIHWPKLADYVVDNTTPAGSGQSKIYKIPDLEKAVKCLEIMRKVAFEDWMSQNNYDFVIFPAAGDVGSSDADVDVDSAEHAWKNGVKYSHGNRALRHLGIPSVTLTMGLLEDKNMPMGLTILGKAYDDESILKAGYAFEQKRQRRTIPPLTPPLGSDLLGQPNTKFTIPRPEKLQIGRCIAVPEQNGELQILLEGRFSLPDIPARLCVPEVDVYIDGVKVALEDCQPVHEIRHRMFCVFHGAWTVSPPPKQDPRNEVPGKVARDSISVLVLARSKDNGVPSGFLKFLRLNGGLK